MHSLYGMSRIYCQRPMCRMLKCQNGVICLCEIRAEIEMRSGDGIADSLLCLGMACAKDLPDIEYERTVFRKEDAGKAMHERPREKALRRPIPEECDVYSWPQTWGSTAIGFGGMGGASMTTAQTTLVRHNNKWAVYFGQRLAYLLDKPVTSAFTNDFQTRSMRPVEDCGKYQ